MPIKAPESYELDRAESPSRHSLSNDDYESDVSEIDELDPLHNTNGRKRRYTDDASQPLRSVFDTEKNGVDGKRSVAWLDRQRSKGVLQRILIPSRFCCMLILLFFATLILLLSAGGMWVYKTGGVPEDGESNPWYPSPRGGTVEKWKESYQKAADLVGKMTLVEKVNVTSGTGWSMGMCVGNTGPVDRLGFPSLCLQDGPLGLRFVDNSTAFPAGVTVGATWNKDLMYERGKAHGFEARMKGIHVLLGPAMGPLGRLPAGGRNWEGFGADPVLQGIAAAQTIRGIQDSGVIATAKHFIGNEQEHFRQSWEWGTPNAMSSNIDDRTLHEIYAWPFAESVRAGVGSVMCSYNQVNNSYACQNSKLLNGILKDELGFQGFMQSDWLAQRSGVAAALAGMDMTMPGDGLVWQDGNSLWGTELTKATLNSSVPMERLNDMALRVVAAWYQLGQDDKKKWPSVEDGGGPNFSSWTNDETGKLYEGSPGSKETGIVNKFVPVRNTTEGGDHDTLVRKVATEGIVMVKNENNTLPLSRNGSGIASHGDGKKIRIGIFGEDAFPNPKGNNACDDRGCNEGTLAMGWGSGAVELPYLVAPSEALHREFDSKSVQLSDYVKNDHKKAGSMAADQDMCIVFINSDAGEGFVRWSNVNADRPDLYPQKHGDELVKSVAEKCAGDTIVVLHTVGPTIVEKWIDLPGVKAVLIAHLPGQESGNALADIIFGTVNPSGHLPYTIAKAEKDYGPSSGILNVPNHIVPQQNFSEGSYFDYRYFDKHSIAPRYEFGFGLSYTVFHLNSLFVKSGGIQSSDLAPRPDALEPPKMDNTLPDPKTALWPEGFRKLKKYVYPYIDSISDITTAPYPYPKGYSTPAPLSPAGGGEGGNLDLYTVAATVAATLTNFGSVPGHAVVQLYISYPKDLKDADGESVDTPVRVLRNWTKLFVGTSNSEKRKKVKLDLTRKDLSYWDVKRQTWILPEGDFEISMGFSSRDLPLTTKFAGVLKLNFGGGK